MGWGVDSYGFIHLAFQEYLTARQLKIESHGDNSALDEAASHFGEGWWTEVILLLVSLGEPSMFEPFMRRLVTKDRFANRAFRQLLSDCVADASVKSPLPFLEVLSQEKRSLEVHLAALHAIRGMGEEHKAAVIETCQQLLQDSPHKEVQDLARELLAARGVVESKALEAGVLWIHERTGLEFVYVPPGRFRMGSERGRDSERPVHQVSFARGFWIGKYPVTNAQYERFMTAENCREPEYWTDSRYNASDQPVVGIDWREAKAYCHWASDLLLNGRALPPGCTSGILLPSEAEWEYAARGPHNRTYPWGERAPSPTLANYNKSKIRRTSPVGQYPEGASLVGAQDMAGNVLEWCADGWHSSYQGAPEDGSPWSTSGEGSPRVVRGGSWVGDADWLRSACRVGWHAGDRGSHLGFRVVLAAPVFGNSSS